MCTHTHRDHSPAAAPLAARTGAPIIGCAPLVLADDGPRADESFDKDYRPDQVLADGETVAGDGWTIEAVATPGHTSNHLCLAVQESGAMFTGDHVMAWSTSVIVPPDGDMADYMASLQKLYEREDKVYYPAHGKKVTNPRQLVRGMMGHRKQRERQILKLLEYPALSAPVGSGSDRQRDIDPAWNARMAAVLPRRKQHQPRSGVDCQCQPDQFAGTEPADDIFGELQRHGDHDIEQARAVGAQDPDHARYGAL